MSRQPAIYIITNKINNKKYIGQTRNPERRIGLHFTKSCHNKLLKAAVKKYGKDNFNIDIIYFADLSDKEIDDMERWYIKTNNSLAPNGYNLEEGGKANKKGYWTGKKLTKEHKEKISKNNARPMLGKKYSKEIAKKMGDARKSEAWKYADEIIELCKQENKYSFREIAEKYNTTIGVIENICPKEVKQMRKQFIYKTCEKILNENIEKGINITDGCKKYNITKTTYYRIMKENDKHVKYQQLKKKTRMKTSTRKKCIEVYNKVNNKDIEKKMLLKDALSFIGVSTSSYEKWKLNFKEEDINA